MKSSIPFLFFCGFVHVDCRTGSQPARITARQPDRGCVVQTRSPIPRVSAYFLMPKNRLGAASWSPTPQPAATGRIVTGLCIVHLSLSHTLVFRCCRYTKHPLSLAIHPFPYPTNQHTRSKQVSVGLKSDREHPCIHAHGRARGRAALASSHQPFSRGGGLARGALAAFSSVSSAF